MKKKEIRKKILIHAFEYFINDYDDFDDVVFSMLSLNCDIEEQLNKLDDSWNVDVILDVNGMAILKVKKSEVNNND